MPGSDYSLGVGILQDAETKYLYTGITRAKQKVYLVGEKKAITVAIKQESTGTRNTILAERIRYYCDIYQKPTQRQPKMEQLRLAV